jgi:hypothetical protein
MGGERNPGAGFPVKGDAMAIGTLDLQTQCMTI